MTKYIEVYSRAVHVKDYDVEHQVTITPDFRPSWHGSGYIAKIFIQEGKTYALAHEQASIASYTLSIDDNGKLQLMEDE